MKKRESFYVTTPIYYPSGKLTIGHTFTTVLADAVARYKREMGFDVMFLTGTDDHGQKIQEAADAAGKPPKIFVDEIVADIKKLWETMDISYDHFIRTTDDYHISRVQKIFKILQDKGDIYLGNYEGHYCVPDETFWTQSQLTKDGKCPMCGGEVTKRKEESYFFKLSKYQDRLLELFENNPEILRPQFRVNEMVNNFIKPGLDDLSISRSTFDWGIPVPGDEKHVLYVWIDALSNYITAIGYPDEKETFNKFWPADLHLIAKEIVRFHSIIWFALLMSLEIPLPKKVLAHGWLLFDGQKISKRDTNNIDPFILINKYGVDAIKYFLLSEYETDQDGQYTEDILIARINSDLANDYGNLLSRTVSMVEKYRESKVPPASTPTDFDNSLITLATSCLNKVDTAMQSVDTQTAMREIFSVIRRANKYIDETTPWILAKNEDSESQSKLDTVLYNLVETLRITANLLRPFMPETSKKVSDQIGTVLGDIHDSKKWGLYPAGGKVCKKDALFPRIEVKK